MIRSIASTSKWLVAGLLASTLLSGCGALVVGGAATTGVLASDRRSTGSFVDDQTLALTVSNKISDKHEKNVHVNVNSYHGRVLITGEAATQVIHDDITDLANSVANVKGVTNEVRVAPNSSIVDRSNDSYISSRVNAAIIADKNLSWGAFVVVVENGVVYLRGTVTEREGAIAAKIASGISGVKRVVKMFEYITPEQLETMREDNQPTQRTNDTIDDRN